MPYFRKVLRSPEIPSGSRKVLKAIAYTAGEMYLRRKSERGNSVSLQSFTSSIIVPKLIEFCGDFNFERGLYVKATVFALFHDTFSVINTVLSF